MLLRSPRSRACLAATLALAAAAACKDQTPTLTGDPYFPGGSRPVTLEVILPASQYLQTLGVYTGYASRAGFPYLVVANQYGGSLNAHSLLRLPFSKTATFSQGGQTRNDTAYTVRSARLVLKVDSAASDRRASTSLQLYRQTQEYDPASATWTLAVDTGSVHTPWAQPGGTKGALLSETDYVRSSGDSAVFSLDSATVSTIRADSLTGVLLQAAEPNSRVQIRSATLRATVRPSNAERDTTITLDVTPTPGPGTLLYTPEPPTPANTFQAGGILAARSIFQVDFSQPLPGCQPPTTCAAVSLKDVQVNRVSLLLRPLAVPNGFAELGPLPLTLWTVPEPELGRRAPLGQLAIDAFTSLGPVTYQLPGDTLVELPITALAVNSATADSTTVRTLALLGEAPPSSGAAPRTFGLGLFEPNPRLRIVYTLPIRPRLP